MKLTNSNGGYIWKSRIVMMSSCLRSASQQMASAAARRAPHARQRGEQHEERAVRLPSGRRRPSR